LSKSGLIAQELRGEWIGIDINLCWTGFLEGCREQEPGESERREIEELGCAIRRRKDAGSVQTVSSCGVVGGPGGLE
jgi:hypothetical protein